MAIIRLGIFFHCLSRLGRSDEKVMSSTSSLSFFLINWEVRYIYLLFLSNDSDDDVKEIYLWFLSNYSLRFFSFVTQIRKSNTLGRRNLTF